MVQTRPYEAIIPLPRDERTAAEMLARGLEFGRWPIDDRQVVWLVAESMDREARNFALELIDFTDHGEVDPDTFDPEQLGQLLKMVDQPAEDLVFRRFTAKGRRTLATERAVAEAVEARGEAIHAELAAEEPPAAIEAAPPAKRRRRKVAKPAEPPAETEGDDA